MSDQYQVPRADRTAAGKELRSLAPRASHRDWLAPADRRDRVDVMVESNIGRVPVLSPIRFGRMLASPFKPMFQRETEV